MSKIVMGLLDANYSPRPWPQGSAKQLLGLNELIKRLPENFVCRHLFVPLEALAVHGTQPVVAVQPAIASDAPRVQQP